MAKVFIPMCATLNSETLLLSANNASLKSMTYRLRNKTIVAPTIVHVYQVKRFVQKRGSYDYYFLPEVHLIRKNFNKDVS